MHIDARKINNTIIESDICIVGAGPAGISIALEFKNSNKKVVLLEGGGFEYEDKIQNLYKGKTTGQTYYPLKSTRLHFFGGTSMHWGGMSAPLDEIDFKKRDWVPNSGWPINKKDLDPYYSKAQKYLDLGPYKYDLDYWREQNTSYIPFPIDKNVVWNKMWQFSPPTRFGTKYRETIRKSKNIHLYTYANVVDIKANENVSSINQVIVKNHNGKTHKVKSKYFILACGAVQNARLLLASNSQTSKGLGNENDLVGRYFMEHPEIDSGELWLKNSLPTDLYLITKKERPPRAELALTENVQKELKILNGTVSLSPLLKARNSKPNIETWVDENPILNSENRKNKSKSFWEKLDTKIDNFKESKAKSIDKAFQLYIRLEQAPNPLSRVLLDSEKDSLGVPRAHLHWKLTSLEKESIRKIFITLGKEFGKSDIGRIKLEKFLTSAANTTPKYNGGWHHMGTTKMNNESTKGVVNSNCQVHGINNLYIAGSSCFPTSGAANPTLTIVALSIRLADYIKNKE